MEELLVKGFRKYAINRLPKCYEMCEGYQRFISLILWQLRLLRWGGGRAAANLR